MAALNLKATSSSSSPLFMSVTSERLRAPIRLHSTNTIRFSKHLIAVPLPVIETLKRHSSPFLQLPSLCSHQKPVVAKTTMLASTMATGDLAEVLPPALDSASDPPAVFDGTTRLYISYTCPYAQRVWITRNCKGLQDKIMLVPIDLKNRPAWYKEKVYSANKVPALEHNNEVRGESLDLIKYIDSHFGGPSLLPDDPVKKAFGDKVLAYSDSFNKAVRSSLKEERITDEAASAFDYIEAALSKFEEGTFFLGQFSLVDIAYAPFVERYTPFLLEVKKYDVTATRPKLALWTNEMDKNAAYRQTRRDPNELVEIYKQRFMVKV